MAEPRTVVSKAALHALRGIVFGTSCSLLLIAEERRQRIKLLRKAAENGRQLRNLRHYTGFSAAVTIDALARNDTWDPTLAPNPDRQARRSKKRNGKSAADLTTEELVALLDEPLDTPHTSLQVEEGRSSTPARQPSASRQPHAFQTPSPFLDISEIKDRVKLARWHSPHQLQHAWNWLQGKPSTPISLPIFQTVVDLAQSRGLHDLVSQRLKEETDAEQAFQYTRWLVCGTKTEPVLAVDAFLANLGVMEAAKSPKNIATVIFAAVNAMVKANSYRAKDMLEALIRLANRDGLSVKAAWFADIIRSRHEYVKSSLQTKELVDMILASNVLSVLRTPQTLRIAIIDVSIDSADRHPIVASLIALIEDDKILRSRTSDPQITAKLVTWEAKLGNWERAEGHLRHMKDQDMSDLAEYAAASEAFLVEYRKHHSVDETESMAARLLDELRAPRTLTMIAIVADKHARRQDVSGLISWLRSCFESAGDMSQAEAQVIFQLCRERWFYRTSSACRLYQTFKKLGMPVYDELLEQYGILGPGNWYAGRQATTERHLRALRYKLRQHQTGQAPLTKNQVIFLGMAEAFLEKRWGKVLRLYKEVILRRIDPSDSLLKLAVRAAIQKEGPESEAALRVLEAAQQSGHNVTTASLPLVLAQLNRVRRDCLDNGSNESRPDAKSAILWLFERFEGRGIQIDQMAFTRASRMCLKSGQPWAAKALCEAATRIHKHPELFFDAHSFAVLLEVYRTLQFYPKLTGLINKGMSNGAVFLSHPEIRKALYRTEIALHARQQAIGNEADLLPAERIYRQNVAKALELTRVAYQTARDQWFQVTVPQRRELQRELERAFDRDSGYESGGSEGNEQCVKEETEAEEMDQLLEEERQEFGGEEKSAENSEQLSGMLADTEPPQQPGVGEEAQPRSGRQFTKVEGRPDTAAYWRFMGLTAAPGGGYKTEEDWRQLEFALNDERLPFLATPGETMRWRKRREYRMGLRAW